MGLTFVGIRQVLAEAMRLSPPDHPHVGSEHLALLALEGPDGLRAAAIDAGADPDQIAPNLASCCTDTLERPRTSEPAITPRTAAVAALAAQLAMADGRTEIRSGDILVALADDPGALAWRGIRVSGLTYVGVYDHAVGHRRSDVPQPEGSALARLLRSMEPAVFTRAGNAQLAADEPLDAREAQVDMAALAYLRDLAALGGRRGLLDADAVAALSSSDAGAAEAAFRETARVATLAAGATHPYPGDPRLPS